MDFCFAIISSGLLVTNKSWCRRIRIQWPVEHVVCVPPTRPTQLSVITFFFPLAHTVASHRELRSSPLHHLWPEERDVHVQCYWIISFVLEFLCPRALRRHPRHASLPSLGSRKGGGRERQRQTDKVQWLGLHFELLWLLEVLLGVRDNIISGWRQHLEKPSTPVNQKRG